MTLHNIARKLYLVTMSFFFFFFLLFSYFPPLVTNLDPDDLYQRRI